jgi:hypothetical protein
MIITPLGTLLGASEGIPHPTLWYPTILGVLVVVAGIGLFCGSAYLLLATNLGARLGFLIAAAALSGFMVLLSALWLTTASPLNTLKGRVPSWKVVAQADSLDQVNIPAVRNIDKQGKTVDPAEAANVKAAVDAELVIPKQQGEAPTPATPKFAKYQLPTEYVVSDTREIGGSKPTFFKLQFTHKPKYATVKVCPAQNVRTAQGAAPPTPTCDPTKPANVLVLERDLGSLRVPPFVVLVCSAILFTLCLLALHWRERDEQEAAAAAERAATGTPAPATPDPAPANA